MQYTIKSGILYQEPLYLKFAKIKSELLGSVKKIYKCEDELPLKTDICYLDAEKTHTGDVCNKEYILAGHDGNRLAVAFSGYAEGDDPDIVGWPICRLPRVDHAKVTIDGSEYILTMHNSQNDTIRGEKGTGILCIMHKGNAGGWTIENDHDFPPKSSAVCLCFADTLNWKTNF